MKVIAVNETAWTTHILWKVIPSNGFGLVFSLSTYIRVDGEVQAMAVASHFLVY